MFNRPSNGKSKARRNFLGAVGSSVLIGSVPNVTKGVRANGAHSVLLLGTHANPITPSVIRDELNDKIGYEGTSQGSGDGAAFPITEFGDGVSVVAYLAYVNEHGRPTHYIGAVPQPEILKSDHEPRNDRLTVNDSTEAVAQRQNRAKTMKRRLEDGNAKRPTASSSDFTADQEWNLIGDGIVENGQCNAGKYESQSWFWRADTESYALGTRLSIYPGVNECDGGWLGSCDKLTRHDMWDKTDLELNTYGSTLKDRQPYGGETGKVTGVSLSASYKNASVGFTYSQPDISRQDNSTTKRAKWKFDWNNNEDASTIYRLASIGDYRDDAGPALGDKIMESYTEMVFKHTDYFVAPFDHDEVWTYYGP